MKRRLTVPVFATLSFVASIGVGLVLIAQPADLPFDAEAWRSSPEQRYRMTKSLAELAGHTHAEAVRLLGEPSSILPDYDGAVRLLYPLGRSGFGVLYLDLEVENKRITSVAVRSD